MDFMRDTYGNGFHLIGVTSSEERRIEYLTERKGLTKEEAKSLLERDANEDLKQGQHTRDAFQHADYFINITEDADQTYNSVSRLMDLLFGAPFISPSFDEYAMFMAYASSLRSADLSRQIGVVIANNHNEIIAMGANDCPKAGGGLYWPVLKEHGRYADEPGGRDYMRGYDSNKEEQQKIIGSLLTAFGIEATEDNIKKVKDTGIGDLTEYGRVVYIEPYPKSKAFQFYPAEISDKKEDRNKIIFERFTGVGPQRFIDLFALSSTRWYAKRRKGEQGKKLEWKRENAELRNPIMLINYLEAEQSALMSFEDETVMLKGKGEKR